MLRFELGLASVLALIACNSSAPPAPPAPTKPPAAAPPAKHRSDVHVDRRVELISIVERLAGADEYREAPATAYVADVDRVFTPFARHRAVVLARALRAKSGIAYDAPMTLAVHLDDQLRPRAALDKALPPLDARWRGADVDGFVAALQAFATDTKFDAFFTAHRPYYAEVEARLQSGLDAEDAVSWFDAFFGPSTMRFTVVPGLLEGPENYGVRVNAPREAYQVIGVGHPDDRGIPVVDQQLIQLLVHEMAHSFVNPMFERHLAALLPAGEAIYKLVAEPMQQQAYADARTMLNESGVRAVVVLYVRDRKGAEAAADATFEEVARMFVWTAELADVLAAYRKSGARDFDAYMAKIAAWFDDLAKRYAHGLPPTPFRGSIDGVVGGKLAVVSSSEPEVKAYARAIHDRFFKTASLGVATERTLQTSPHQGLIAYGTPATNPVIADVVARGKWSIADGEIRLGAHKFTDAIVLIACWPRPDDPEHGIAVYAAAHAADIVDINAVVAGGTDWVVARKLPNGSFETLGQGNFSHAPDGSWLPPRS